MLRKIRISAAIIIFCLITLLFLDFTGTLHASIGWLADIQFLPALLALNVSVVIILVLLTVLLGRLYCSVICPLGVFQDVVSRLATVRKKNRFTYSPALSWLRYGMLAIFVVALVAGIGSVVALLAPYSSYGRIASNLFAPLYGWGNNLLAYFAERADSYMFYTTEVWIKSLPTFIIAVATFIILSILAWRNGRTYCNTICPVGTILGFIARFSIFRPVIDTEKCHNCSLCARRCKAACIDYKNHQIDYSRCVACMDCIDACKSGAISYTYRRKNTKETPKAQPDATRRNFLTGVGVLATTLVVKAEEKKVDGGLAVILDKKAPQRATPIVPPGAMSLRHLSQHCTGCQLCVSVCPNEVLRPSTALATLMQPEVSYERGYCRPECTKCGDVCPAGAIRSLTPAEKSATHIGRAVWIKENCIPLTDGQSCGNCARHCPTHAITMIPSHPDDASSIKIPIVNEELCIGCGACENLCPARPFSAIYVEGYEVHHTN